MEQENSDQLFVTAAAIGNFGIKEHRREITIPMHREKLNYQLELHIFAQAIRDV